MSKTKTNGATRAGQGSAHPIFDAMIAEARKAPPEELISADELDRRRPLTPEEIAAADAWLDELERDDAVSVGPATGGELPAAPSVDGTGRGRPARRARPRASPQR